MKLSFILLIVTFFQASAMTFAQKVSIQVVKAPLKTVFYQLSKQTGYNFMADANLSRKIGVVTLDEQNTDLKHVIEKCFAGIDVEVILNADHKTALIKEVPGTKTKSQQTNVVGKVQTVDNQPMQGVSIGLKNKPAKAFTDDKGHYSIAATPSDTILYSFIGYASQEQAVNGRSNINVILQAVEEEIDDVVIVGYGTQKKINLTGSVGSVSSKEIENRPITNINQVLQGQVAGLMVHMQGGMPGGEDARTMIRGISTFTANGPLIIIDGIASSLASLNPNDIESISVLKDASATAIYGARASGGVILVTTKKGIPGKASFSYDGYVGIQKPSNLPEMVTAYEHAMLYKEGELNDNPNTTTFRFSDEVIERYRTGELPSTDRIKYLFNPALQTRHDLALTGGNERSDYYMSAGYLDQAGIIRNTGFKQYNFRLNNGIQATDHLKVSLNANFTPTQRMMPSTSTYSGGPTRSWGDVIAETYRRGAVYPLFTSDGQWASVDKFANRLGMASKDGGFQDNRFSRLTGVFNATYNLTNNFVISGMYGAKFDWNRTKNYSTRMKFISPEDNKSVDYDYTTNSLTIANASNTQHNLQFLLDYENSWNEEHNFKVLAGFSQEWFVQNEESVGRRDFLTDDIYVIDAGSSNTLLWSTSGTASEWALRSFFGRANYAFKNRYLLEVNLRYDGSSRFAAPVRWGIFPSISAGWRISEEAFLQEQELFSELKLRASWGQVGNQNVALYQYASTIGTDNYYFNGQPNTSAYYMGNPNPNLTWETKTTFNIGVDASAFNNKLSIVADVFKDVTDGILLDPPVPDSYGRGKPYRNVGVIHNKGWEIDLRYRNNIGKFNYSFGAQISDAVETVIDMAGTGPWISGNNFTDIGTGINMWYGWEADGLFQTEEEVKNHPFQNVVTGPGDIRYVEHGGDPNTITADDRIILGRSSVRLPYGIHLQMSWKGFDFSAFGQGVGYRKTYLSWMAGHAFADATTSAFKYHLDRWTPDNPNARFPKTRIGGVNKSFSSFHLQNAAYFRLKNIQLGYTLPDNFSEKLRLRRCRIYFSAENILTVTKFLGYDPEEPNGDGRSYPLNKVSTLGLNLSF